MTVVFLIGCLRNKSEAVPAEVGAIIIILWGLVPSTELSHLASMLSGPFLMIVSTFIMAAVLDSIGFYRKIYTQILHSSQSSGILLYWYLLLFCFLMTMLFNPYSSIWFTTPVILQLTNALRLQPHQQFPYLLSGVLICMLSGTPIGISSMQSLWNLDMNGLDWTSYSMLLVSSILAASCSVLMLFLCFYKVLPKHLDVPISMSILSTRAPIRHGYYRLKTVARWIDEEDAATQAQLTPNVGNHDFPNTCLFRLCAAVVIISKAAVLLGMEQGMPGEWFALSGAVLIIVIGWLQTGVGGTLSIMKHIPWQLMIICWSTLFIVYAFELSGITTALWSLLKELPLTVQLQISLGMEVHSSAISRIISPASLILVGALTITGTFVSWMLALRQNHTIISWKPYIKVICIILPVGLMINLICIYVWIRLI
nr:SLC13 family permease [Paenibacillus sp. UNC451MF]